ncbi:MAG: UDP-3-O-(3-hydroxymyristoyl)glucosamine N-acyltransferase [Chitinispirillaceae bacterium]|nr:UDP-3-O-(3-hydroxymyristoyl)glucosamine N-acyltransferase [Chitinispirillaceae bacterium]
MKLSAIAQAINATGIEQGLDIDIEGIASPQQAHERQITFLSHKRFRAAAEASRASAVIVRTGESLRGKICLEVNDPYVGYAKVARLFEDKQPLFNKGVADTAVVDSSAHLGPGTSIGPLSVIGQGVTIGKNCRIEARCVIERDVSIGNDCRIDSGAVIRYGSRIGDRVIVQAGAIIGSDGFGNARENDRFIRIPCFGSAVIEDDVEVGANTTIDRGSFEPTVIRRGVKLDNLIHIAHNVEVGDDTAIAAQTGVSGSTRIGKQVLIGGQAGFVGHIEIGDNAFIGAKAGVSKSVKPGGKVTGYPARDLMTMRRIEASQAQLPELLKELKQLRNEIDALKKHMDRK